MSERGVEGRGEGKEEFINSAAPAFNACHGTTLRVWGNVVMEGAQLSIQLTYSATFDGFKALEIDLGFYKGACRS